MTAITSFKTYSVDQIATLSAAQIKTANSAAIKTLSADQLKALSPDQIAAIGQTDDGYDADVILSRATPARHQAGRPSVTGSGWRSAARRRRPPAP